MSSSSSFFILASLSLIILVSSLFTKAAAVRTILNGRIHFSPPTNNPVYIPGIGIGDSTASSSFIRSLGGNAVSSRSYISAGDCHMLPRGSLGNNPIARSPGVNAVSSHSYTSAGDGHMLPRGSLGNNPISRSPGVNAVSSRSYTSAGDGHMLPRGSLGNNPIARSPGGNAGSSRSYIPVGRFMLHKRSLGYIPIDMLAASRLPSLSAYVVESEPPSKPTPPTCYPRC